MSPEHALGEKLTPAADLWSLGVLFWETLCAERLFAQSAPSMTLQAISEKPIPLPTVHRELPPHIVSAVHAAPRARHRQAHRHRRRPRQGDRQRCPRRAQLPRVDLGGWLSGRFPEDAAAGKSEAARCARMRRRTPVPIGLVEGTAAGTVLRRGRAHGRHRRGVGGGGPRSHRATKTRPPCASSSTPPRPRTAPPSACAPATAGRLRQVGRERAPRRVAHRRRLHGGGRCRSTSRSRSTWPRARARLPELNPPRDRAPARTSSGSRAARTRACPPRCRTIDSGVVVGGRRVPDVRCARARHGRRVLVPRAAPEVTTVYAYDDASGDNDIIVAADGRAAARARRERRRARGEGRRQLVKPEPPRSNAPRRLRREGARHDPADPARHARVLLPVLIAGLGLLALAGALPALVVARAAPRRVAQVALILLRSLVLAVLVKRGGALAGRARRRGDAGEARRRQSATR